MRPVPGGVLFLFGLSLLKCSVFPERAPLVVHPATGGSGGSTVGSGGAKDAGASTGAGGAGTGGDAQTPSSGGQGTGGAAPGSGGSQDAGDSSAQDASGTPDGSVRTVTYVASIDDCVEAVVQPQAGACLGFSTATDGPNELWVDTRRTNHRAFTTYLLFPVDGTIANHTVESVELRVTVTTHLNAPGTGADVSQVGPFTAQTLYRQTPTVLQSLALSPGPALSGQTVIYSLPVSAVTAGDDLALALTMRTGGDGTGYWGTYGDPKTQAPPTLIITYR